MKRCSIRGQRVQIDVKYVPSVCLVGEAAEENGGYYYQYSFIDEYSRFRYLEAFKEHSTYSSTVFLKHVVKKFPYLIECVQTDNGTEFTNEMGSGRKKKPTLFETTLKELHIRHKKIRLYTPRHNGKVERSHRKDNEEFYASHTFYSFISIVTVLMLTFDPTTFRTKAICSGKQITVVSRSIPFVPSMK